MTDVDQVLKQIYDESKKSKLSTHVEKDIDLELDPGNLLAVDINPHDAKKLKCEREEYLMALARDNTQVLINQMFKLPKERSYNTFNVKVPAPTTVLPREKPIPKPKPLTKWQEFAKLKGIKNKKKSRMVWDEKSQSYKPRWGYKRANDNTKEWVIEVPGNADPNEDQFAKRNEAKRERVAKNELQRLRNIARSRGKKVPGVGEALMPGSDKSLKNLDVAFHHAKSSTASLGRFEDTMKGEKVAKGKKRKFNPLVQEKGVEAKNQMKIFKEIQKKNPKINVSKAVNRQLGNQEATSKGIKKGSAGKGKRRDRRR